VCRGHYEDYKEHVESDIHLSALRKSPYQHHIHTFCLRVQALLDPRDEEVKAIDLTMEENSEKSIENFEVSTPSKFAAS
jgi:hypothetical protein